MLVLAEAPHLLVALEQSALGAAIRESVWAYPLANIGHIVALTLFAGSVAVMDLRLLGAFSSTPPAAVVRPARAAAMIALLLMALTGFTLFAAEASHVAMNPVFQVKAGLIGLGILNALLLAAPALAKLGAVGPNTALPARARLAAVLSLAIWISVAACGRLIAYF
jgi:uncharacterized protein DUF6644